MSVGFREQFPVSWRNKRAEHPSTERNLIDGRERIEPFARWARGNRGGVISGQVKEAPLESYKGLKPDLRELFRLYEKSGVDHYAEGYPTAPLEGGAARLDF